MSTHAEHLRMEQAALEYAGQGLYIVPLHAPLFNNAGECVGCTCEAYKRSRKYKAWLESKGRGHKFDPAFKCRTPGKHPRQLDWETEASKDPVQIRKWFARWLQLNLGIAPGKSGLLVLDADAYKENYAGADLLTLADQQTATMITGNRGQHLYYQMPEGAQYGNEVGDLPDGIDIRGHGGMVVVYPSIHPNGNRYEWEDGYSLAECPPIPLPAALVAILDDAQAKAPAQAVTFTTPTTEPPQLGQWRLSKTIKNLIFNPAPDGQRSEADMSVATSLVYAGATDDDVLAVFEHCPIGVNGKFAERGRDYLALTIGNARVYAAAHPRPDVLATVEQIRLWIRTHAFEGHAPSSADGIYRTDGVDTKIADAVLDAMAEDQRFDIVIGKKRLGKLAGVGPNTALRALDRLNGWLFDVTPKATEFGARVALVDSGRLQLLDPSLVVTHVKTGGPFSENDKISNEYSPRKAYEPFLVGTSRVIKQQMAKAAIAMGISDKEAKEQLTFAAFGEGGIRVIDALIRAGDMTASELVEETGKKLSSIRTACARLVQHGLLIAERPNAITSYTYSLADDVWERLAAVAPHLRTYKLNDQREAKRLEGAQQWTQAELALAEKAGDKEKALKLERRFAGQAKARIPHLLSLYPELPTKEIERLAYEVAAYKRSPEKEAKVKANRNTQRAEHRDTVRLIADLIADTLDAGVTKADVLATVSKFGFDPDLVRSVLSNQQMIERAALSVGAEALAMNIAAYKADGISRAVATQALEVAGFIAGEIERAWDRVSA